MEPRERGKPRERAKSRGGGEGFVAYASRDDERLRRYRRDIAEISPRYRRDIAVGGKTSAERR